MDRDARNSWAIVVAIVTLLTIASLLPAPSGWPAASIRTAALTVGAIALWATGILPIGVTAIAYLSLAMLFAVQPAEVVFSGFHSGAFWLVVAGLIMGAAVKHTGLGARIARALAARISGSYLAILSGIAVATTALNFLMPSSMGRIVMLIPVVIAMADRYGFTAGRPGRAGMVLVATAVAFIPSGSVMTALVPNLVMVGAAENLYDSTFTYAAYLLANFPVMGALRTVAIVLLAWLLFKDSPEPEKGAAEPAPMNLQEKQLATILCTALVLWITDGVHGIPPAWIGLGAAVVLLLPGLRFVPSDTLSTQLDYNSVFYTAAVLGMGAVISGTGLAAQLGSRVTAVLPVIEGADGTSIFLLTSLSALTGPLVTNPAVPAVLSPLAGEFAEYSGLPVQVVLMTQIAGFSNVIFPYQASPVLVGMTIGGVGLRSGTRMFAALTLVTLLVFVPLQTAWWRIIGLLG